MNKPNWGISVPILRFVHICTQVAKSKNWAALNFFVNFGQRLNGRHVDMRGFLVIVVAIGCLWAVDLFALDGAYSSAVWQEANILGQKINDEVRRGLKYLEG